MKLPELRKEVYRLAEVATTKQLKAKYADIKTLDMRYKASWIKALEQLKEQAKTQTETKNRDSEKLNAKENVDFESWLNNPPEEYKDLFAEAEAAFTTIDDKLAKGKKLTKTARAMAESLNEFADASLEESQQLAKAAQRSKNASAQADLN